MPTRLVKAASSVDITATPTEIDTWRRVEKIYDARPMSEGEIDEYATA